MIKILEILFFVLLLNSTSLAEILQSESPKIHDIKEEITNEWLKDKTVNQLKEMHFNFDEKNFGLDNSLVIILKKYFSRENSYLYIICFADLKKTNCRLL